jgi:hypothetical protein
MDKINAKVSALPVKTLKEMAIALFNDTRDGSEIVLSAVLSVLESKLPETDFVAFCDAI